MNRGSVREAGLMAKLHTRRSPNGLAACRVAFATGTRTGVAGSRGTIQVVLRMPWGSTHEIAARVPAGLPDRTMAHLFLLQQAHEPASPDRVARLGVFFCIITSLSV
jgi:hypothetical protein